MVGRVWTTSPSLSLNRMVVLPAPTHAPARHERDTTSAVGMLRMEQPARKHGDKRGQVSEKAQPQLPHLPHLTTQWWSSQHAVPAPPPPSKAHKAATTASPSSTIHPSPLAAPHPPRVLPAPARTVEAHHQQPRVPPPPQQAEPIAKQRGQVRPHGEDAQAEVGDGIALGSRAGRGHQRTKKLPGSPKGGGGDGETSLAPARSRAAPRVLSQSGRRRRWAYGCRDGASTDRRRPSRSL